MFVLVHPDILKIEKPYWFKISSETKNKEFVNIGSQVRFTLNSRKTKGWVVETSETKPEINQEFSDIDEIYSIGFSPHVLDICDELAKRYLVSPVVFYRKFSPKNTISPREAKYESAIPGNSDIEHMYLVDPRMDRRELITSLISDVGSTIIIAPSGQARLQQYFSKNYNVVNATLSDKTTFIKSMALNTLIIGNRNSLFSPSTDCRSIIVLDDSYEQLQEERTPKFHILDCARLLAAMIGADLNLITSVPSVYSYKMQTTDLRTNNKWPDITIENIKNIDPAKRQISDQVIRSIRKTLDSGLNSALVVNNISLSKLLICSNCSTTAACPKCSHHLQETTEASFECRFCGYNRPVICLECQGTKFKKYRKGTHALTSEIQKLFPDNKVIELTAKTNNEEITSQSDPGGGNVFIATSSIFYRQSLYNTIGNIILYQFDTYLYQNSIAAFNQSLVAVNSSLRMLKKSDHPNPLIVSTNSPDHPLIKDIQNQDLVSNNHRDLELREQLKLAPNYATAEIISSKDAINKLVSEINESYVSGQATEDEQSSLMLVAPSHRELAEIAYKPVRNVASNNKIAIYIDNYD